ncbi:DUF4393 domain-containing protein [Burkholderia ambifaria]|uniref:DUF4393 domain-containing protein n=1 Tax=Burkholderia ambifaria TaxID=152480 RepID=A0AA41JNB8_9BURK|nr:DUF4393 domain-containing protein [Burkholderia ambifaria]MBR8133267.1 DUF4393 domain-containing protein [Burkholderia ambifaria]PRD98893.1 hypothetical protein C6P77_17485 [Burkholderia ambifaria]
MSDDGVKNAIEDAKSTVELIGAIAKVAGDHPDVKAAGTNLAKSAKTITQFINVGLLPLAAINYGYGKAKEYFEHRFASDVAKAAETIPPDNLCEPEAVVIGPALQGLAFTHGYDSLKNMYLKLIATAMDDRHAQNAHPAFAEIIRQLNSLEAQVLNSILKINTHPIVQVRFNTYREEHAAMKFAFPENYQTVETHVMGLRRDDVPWVSRELPALVDNWIRLGLVEVSYETSIAQENVYEWVKTRPEYRYWVPQDAPPRKTLAIASGRLDVTAFGRQFAAAIGVRT